MTVTPRQGDVVATIKAAVDPAAYDLTRAEGRADFDDALRAELARIEDHRLRMHAGEMVRNWRKALFEWGDRERAKRMARYGSGY